jgi:uncharacterized membrane protein
MTSSAVERAVARVLLWGGLVSVALMLTGLCVYAAEGPPHAWERTRIVQKHPADGAVRVFTSLTDVSRGLRQRPPDGLAIATLGLLCLLATPLAGVGVASAYFWRERDLPYALIGAVVLAMLLVSLVLEGA